MRPIAKVALAAAGIAGFLILLVAILVGLMILEPLWDRPPDPTVRKVEVADLVGAYHCQTEHASGQFDLVLKADGTFVQTVTFNHGQPGFTVEGRWQIMRWGVAYKSVRLDKAWDFRNGLDSEQVRQPSTELGLTGMMSLNVIDSYDHQNGFALYGGGSGESGNHQPVLLEKKRGGTAR